MRKFFKLQSGEKVVEDIKPLPQLRIYFLLSQTLIVLFTIGWLVWIPFIAISVMFGLGTMALLILLLLISWIIANKRYEHQHYWLTNKRVIYKRGIIGYRISSIPLERISDVIVSRSFFEQLFGFGSILIQSLAGQVTAGRSLGSEGSLIAVPDPEETQKKIFDLIKAKRKKEHITM
jgi:uncharacterized membrane protein YdbT with pleckstrin-like domain